LKLSHASGTGILTVTPAGTRALKVTSVAGFAAGKVIVIEAGDAAERATIASVGTAGLGGTGITLSSPTTRPHFGPVTVEQITAAAGAVDIKLTNVPVPAPTAAQPGGQPGARGGGGGGGGRGGATPSPVTLDAIDVGARLTIGDGADAEQVTVRSVGTGGLIGTGITFAPALRKEHNGEVLVHGERRGVPASAGTDVTLTAALAKAHGAGTEARALGSGVLLTEPLIAPIAEGDAFTSRMNAYYPQARWTAAIQNDFAARADWQIKPYAQANHAPVVSVPARTRTAAAGQDVALSGVATDPDGNRLTYKWWQYREAGTYAGAVTLSGSETANATFTVPRNARPGDTIHLILEVQDSGTPPLTRYARVIVTVSGARRP
jgi:hypothetical protein